MREFPRTALAVFITSTLVFLSCLNLSVQAAGSLEGRLGGSVSSIEDRFGMPDARTNEYIRYNSLMSPAGSATFVFYPTQETVGKIAIVFSQRPDTLVDPGDFTNLVMDYTPADSSCMITDPLGIPDSLTCHSDALAEVFPSSVMSAIGLMGSPGDIGILIDPIPDSYYEVIIQPGLQPGMVSFPAGQGGVVTSEDDAQVTSSPDLAGRIGGTRVEFEAIYGAPYDTTTGEAGTQYLYYGPAGSMLTVSFNSDSGVERVWFVGSFSTGVTSADLAQIVLVGVLSKFAPADLECSSPQGEGQMFTISCTSLTLREAVGESRVEIRVIAAGGDFIVFVSHPIQ